MTQKDIQDCIAAQRTFFSQNTTREYRFRMDQLSCLAKAIRAYEKLLTNALHADMKKPAFEAFTSEIAVPLLDISFTKKHLKRWMKPTYYKKTALSPFAKAQTIPEPRGNVLIIAPWNYPVHLALLPLVSSIAAGNCSLIKPSEITPETSRVLTKMIAEYFDPGFITCVEGAVQETQWLLEEQYDYIFFTGSTHVGKIVMRAAAKHLTPLTLELGGKCPVIVGADANINQAAKDIIWGTCANAGQTCVAPDHVLVHQSQKDAFIAACKTHIHTLYGKNPQKSPDYARIVSDSHFDRLVGLLEGQDILCGGTHNKKERYIAPTLVSPKGKNPKIMQEEIFGPLLPIISFSQTKEVVTHIQSHPSPLAIYLYAKKSITKDMIIPHTKSGAVSVNSVLSYTAHPGLPFGGVGDSGFGAYHGKHGFDAFTYARTIYTQNNPQRSAFRFPPYSAKTLRLAKKIFRI